jgi:hypothetical protein
LEAYKVRDFAQGQRAGKKRAGFNATFFVQKLVAADL